MRAIPEARDEDERQNESSRRTRPRGCRRRRRGFRGRGDFARTRGAGDRRRIFWPASQRRRRRLNLILLHRRRLRTRTEPFGHFIDLTYTLTVPKSRADRTVRSDFDRTRGAASCTPPFETMETRRWTLKR